MMMVVVHLEWYYLKTEEDNQRSDLYLLLAHKLIKGSFFRQANVTV